MGDRGTGCGGWGLRGAGCQTSVVFPVSRLALEAPQLAGSTCGSWASPKASAVTSPRAHRCWGRPCPRGCELLPPHPRPNSLPQSPVRALLWDWRNGERLAVANPIPHRHALALWQFQSTFSAFLSLTIEQKQTCTAPLNAQDENILPVPLVTGSALTLASRPRQLLETLSPSPAPLRTLLLLRNPHCILPHPPIFTLSPT